MKTYKEALACGRAFFGSSEIKKRGNTNFESEELLIWATGKDKTWIFIHQNEKLEPKAQKKYQKALFDRKNGMPMAYIMGFVDFCGLRIKTDPRALIPRMETEELVGKIIENIKNSGLLGEKSKKNVLVPPGGAQRFLEVGVGSGCISLGLKKAFPRAKVTGLDINKAALSLAQENMEANGLEITLIASDMLENVPDGAKFDLIVANLPYVPHELAKKELKNEPAGAIFSDLGGLWHYKKLLGELNEKKVDFGVLWLEFLDFQAEDMRKLCKKNEMKIEISYDLSGKVAFGEIMKNV